MAHRKLKSCCKNRPGGALQLRLRQYRERPSGPLFYCLIASHLFGCEGEDDVLVVCSCEEKYVMVDWLFWKILSRVSYLEFWDSSKLTQLLPRWHVTFCKTIMFSQSSANENYCVMRECENIHSWISLCGDLALSHQDGIYGFKFSKRFLEISSSDLALLLN